VEVEVEVDIDDEVGLLELVEARGVGGGLDEEGVMVEEEDVLRNSAGGIWSSVKCRLSQWTTYLWSSVNISHESSILPS
jgi:hypothetical protein